MFSEDLYLKSATAKALYEKYAKDLPIIDYHCHLSPRELCENRRFSNIGELWLAHDHYKWRAMRAFGIDEELVSGGADWEAKFCAFAQILPKLAGNPLYIWCALELKRYFGIGEALCAANAKEIYEKTSAMIKERDMTPAYFINASGVEFVATTDDPADSLQYHIKIKEDDAYKNCRIVPAFRPDRAMGIERADFPAYVKTLGDAAGVAIKDFKSMIAALEERLKAFAAAGSMLNDNGLTGFIWTDYAGEQIDRIFSVALAGARQSPAGANIGAEDVNRYRSAFLYETAKLYAKYGFTAQYHVGAYRNANSAMFRKLGPDSGYDSVDDPVSIRSFGRLLDILNSEGSLPRTILYPLDVNQFEAFAALAANFGGSGGGVCGVGSGGDIGGGGNSGDGTIGIKAGGAIAAAAGEHGGGRGWVQLGAPWWFNDQYYGITKQFESVANFYPVALSVGMLTDSRSLLSYPRHELYRRALCAYLGELVDRNEYFSGEEALGEIIRDVCYGNAKSYFNL